MKNKKFVVYAHVFPNGKRYIGITSKVPKNRWQNGTGYSKNNQPVVYNAIQKYGWNNIEHIILFKNLIEKDAKNKEIELIKEYNTYCHNKNSNGYNMTFGGEGCSGHKNNKNVSLVNKKRLTGKTGDLCPNSKSVICNEIRYESITSFCKKNNLSRAMVERWLKGEVRMPKKWVEYKLKLEFGKDKTIKIPQKRNWKNLVEYNKKIYNSQRELADELGVSNSTICNWLSGKWNIPDIYKKNGLKYHNK